MCPIGTSWLVWDTVNHKRIKLEEVKDPSYVLGKLIQIDKKFIFIYDVNVKKLTFSYFWTDQLQMITVGDLKSLLSHLYPEYISKWQKKVECYIYE
mgnify:FL=1